jgi:hypothetical protein
MLLIYSSSGGKWGERGKYLLENFSTYSSSDIEENIFIWENISPFLLLLLGEIEEKEKNNFWRIFLHFFSEKLKIKISSGEYFSISEKLRRKISSGEYFSISPPPPSWGFSDEADSILVGT